jgi:hypothetical protein
MEDAQADIDMMLLLDHDSRAEPALAIRSSATRQTVCRWICKVSELGGKVYIPSISSIIWHRNDDTVSKPSQCHILIQI